MDLGAVICRPKAPLCARCPVARFCAARAAGRPDAYPRKREKAARPRRFGVAYLAMRDGAVARMRRPERGLLGGMLGLPTSDWRGTPFTLQAAEAAAPIASDWRSLGEVEHVFTHFALTLTVLRGEVSGEIAGALWTPLAQAGDGLPSVFLKALRAGTRLV